MKDHYKTLDLERNATDEQIKQAFRDKSKLHHPDVTTNPNKVEAEEKFKEINEAYTVLSDPDKKAHYDNPRSQQHPDLDSILSRFGFRAGGGMHFSSTQVIQHQITISLYEAIFGGDKSFTTPIGNITIKLPEGIQSGQVIGIELNQNANNKIILQVRINVHTLSDKNKLKKILKKKVEK